MPERLSDQAASFLALESGNTPMHAVSVSVVEGKPTLESIRQHVKSRLHLLPHYRQRLAFVPLNLAQPEWVDHAGFKISEHIKDEKLPPHIEDLEAALNHALSLIGQPLERSLPLWKMVLLTGLPGVTLLVHIVHHAMLEGVSLGDDAQILFDLQAQPRTAHEPPRWQPQVEPDNWQRMGSAIQHNTQSFTERTRRLQNSAQNNSEMIRRATEAVTRFVTEPAVAAPWNRALVSDKREFAFLQYPHTQLRTLRKKLGGTENDIVLTALIEAAARYMRDSECDADRSAQHLRVMCPMRIRREDQHGARGSRVSGIFPVFSASPMSAGARHEQVRWEVESIKQNREAQALQLLSELTPPLPPVPSFGSQSQADIFSAFGLNFTTFNPASFIRQLMPGMEDFPVLNPTFNSAMAGFNFTCTTVPGARTPQYIAGCTVREQMALPVLAGNLGFGATVTTYDQSVTFNLLADPSMLSDLPRMTQHITDVMAELTRIANVETA